MLKNIDHSFNVKTVLPVKARTPLLKDKRNKGKRNFSNLMRDTNRAFLPATKQPKKPIRVVFLLPENFSMMAYTAAVDVLVTANLVLKAPLLSFTAYGIDSATVKSDLGIEISTQGRLDALIQNESDHPDIMVVCGGFRCSVTESRQLTEMLKAAARQKTILGGIWNGAIPLAYAGLLDNLSCALHPDNHAFMRERFHQVNVTQNTLELERNVITCAGPASTLEMMLQLIKQLQGKETMRAIREILSCDQAEHGNYKLAEVTDNPTMPDNLRDLIQLMNSNIEEPLNIDELVSCIGISRRQIERIFQTHMETSPSRYYLEVRVTHARRLLLQSNETVYNIALACGFVSSSHFSNCFKDFFGTSPTLVREQYSRDFA